MMMEVESMIPGVVEICRLGVEKLTQFGRY